MSAASTETSGDEPVRRSTVAVQDLFQSLPGEARILLIRLRSMGDCLLLTAPIRALRQEFPGFAVSILVEPAFEACFRGNPDVSETLVVQATKFRTVTRLRRRRFDAVINLHGGPTSLVYALGAKGPAYGFEEAQYSWLYKGIVPRFRKPMHSVELNIERLRWLGLRAPTIPSLRYESDSADRRRARDFTGSGPYFVVHPSARLTTKQWAPEGYREVVRQVAEDGRRPVVVAGPGEEEVARRVAGGTHQCRTLVGPDLGLLAEVIRGADIYIGNDTGPMHLAAAVGTPTVAVWGSSDSQTWHPWKVPHRVVQNSFDCNPCAGYRCHVAPTPLCIESVTVDQVLDAVESLLQERDRPMPSRPTGRTSSHEHTEPTKS